VRKAQSSASNALPQLHSQLAQQAYPRNPFNPLNLRSIFARRGNCPVPAMTNASLVPAVIHEVPLQYYVFFATALFCIGVTGVLLRRNAIIIFMCIELMLNAVNILLTAFAAYRADPNGQVFVFFIMAVAAAEVSVGLGIIVMIYRNFQNTDVNLLNRLKW
jgi:NADH-quinone oxidoreductase subunit K